MENVVIYGSSGQAESIGEIIMHTEWECELKLIAYINDFIHEPGEALDGVPIISLQVWKKDYSNSKFILGVGSPNDKRALALRVQAEGGQFLQGVWDKSAGIRSALSIGNGSYIGYGTYIGPRCVLHDHVSILANCSIGHDVTIESHCTICPSTSISGYVHVESDVFIGAGATIVNGSSTRRLVIGSGAMIAAGSVVTKTVFPGNAVAGNPARSLRAIALDRRASPSA